MTITKAPSTDPHTVDQALQQAITLHKAGNLQNAESLYRSILKDDPHHPDANHNLGVLALQVNKPDAGLNFFKVAVEANPSHQQYWLSYIDTLIQTGQYELARWALLEGRQKGVSGETLDALAGRLDGPSADVVNALVGLFNQGLYSEVEAVARSLTAKFPQHGFGWKALGVSLMSQGNGADALEPSQKAVELLPMDAAAHNNLGNTLRVLGQLFESEVSCRRALEIRPDFADAMNNLGNTLKDLGRLEEAEASYRCALEIMPDFAEAHSNLGVVLMYLDRLEDAEICCRRALEIMPDFACALSNLGNILRDFGRLEESEACCRRVLEIRPDFAEAHCNLGNALKDLGRLEEAESSYRRALKITPDFAEASNNLGKTLRDTGRLIESEFCCRRALEIRPDYAEAYNNLGNTLKDLGRLTEAEASYLRALEFRPNYAAAHSNLLFTFNYSASRHYSHLLEEARSWEVGCICEVIRTAARTRQFYRAPLACRRLRVGYVSGDFRLHAVSFFLEQLLAHHDTSRLEVFAYSTNARRDVVTVRIESLVEHWIPVVGLSDQKLFARIEADQIDVLIDLSGHTSENRLGLFAHRAAPVQAHWLGYFATTGLSEMDYWIGDAIITPPETDHHFSETVWRLPRTWISYEGKAEAPESHWEPTSDSTLWLGSFNNLGKFTPATFALWARVLHELPEARLLLKTKELREELNRQRILEVFTSYGIENERIELQDRSVTADWVSHMSYYDRLDIALDPVCAVGGGTTTCDALWMGVPVVSLVGDRMGSRMTASMLDAIGRSEWLATTEDEYVAKVVALAHDVEGRKVMRAGQRERVASSPLCDAKGLAQAMEDAFEAMFERWWVNTQNSD